jgi:hypothetical protein
MTGRWTTMVVILALIIMIGIVLAGCSYNAPPSARVFMPACMMSCKVEHDTINADRLETLTSHDSDTYTRTSTAKHDYSVVGAGPKTEGQP